MKYNLCLIMQEIIYGSSDDVDSDYTSSSVQGVSLSVILSRRTTSETNAVDYSLSMQDDLRAKCPPFIQALASPELLDTAVPVHWLS